MVASMGVGVLGINGSVKKRESLEVDALQYADTNKNGLFDLDEILEIYKIIGVDIPVYKCLNRCSAVYLSSAQLREYNEKMQDR